MNNLSIMYLLFDFLLFPLQENLPLLFHEIVQFDPDKLQNGGGSGFGLWSKSTAIFLSSRSA